MTILITSNSHKEIKDTVDVNKYIYNALIKLGYDRDYVKYLPLCDGGDGLFASYRFFNPLSELVPLEVKGPLGDTHSTLIIHDKQRSTAVIDGAMIAGLSNIPVNKRDITRSWGWGIADAIKCAIQLDVDEIIIGMGGSALGDLGVGVLQGLGAEIFIGSMKLGLSDLKDISLIKNVTKIRLEPMSKLLGSVKIKLLSDVNNVLLGVEGAANTFGPQKSATPDQVAMMEQNGCAIRAVMLNDYDFDIDTPLVGAAGGLGSVLRVHENFEIIHGFDYFSDLSELPRHLGGVSCVITGEGRFDRTTLYGKLPHKMQSVVEQHRTSASLFGIFGSVRDKDPGELGFDRWVTFPPNTNDLDYLTQCNYKNWEQHMDNSILELFR